MKALRASLAPVMMNLMHLRNGKKAYVIYAVGLFVFCSVGLVMKNFNDKIALMSDSVHSYQEMIDKQSEQMKTITREKERFKRELAEEREDKEVSMAELRKALQTMEEQHRQETRRQEKEMMELQERHRELGQEKGKLEAKYKTLSKANGDAVADIEQFKGENKLLRNQLHDASTTKTSEQLALRDSMAKMSVERDKYKEQYSALFRQLQQSMDSVQLLKTEKDRLQEQIREIQRLSGGSSSSAAPEVHQVQPESGRGSVAGASSARPAQLAAQVMEEPGRGQAGPSSSTPASVARRAGPALAQAPPPLQARAYRAPVAAQPPVQVRGLPPAPFPAAAYRAHQEVQPLQPQLVRRRQNDVYSPHHNEVDVLQAPRAKQAFAQQVMPPGWYPGAGGQEPYARHAAQPAAQYPGGLRGDWAGQVGQAAWHQAPGYGFQQAGEEEEAEEEDEEEEEEAQAPYQQHGNNARDF